jgi:hypothetical protein
MVNDIAVVLWLTAGLLLIGHGALAALSIRASSSSSSAPWD